ncbi:MAG: Ig-like domain-containing protein [Oscillospiraceae bacterium]|nr:Ig-like domain-containing protein [Oscillospiraceae bacterium]
MRKIVHCFIILFLLFSLFPAVGQADYSDELRDISSVQDLLAIRDDPSGSYILTADLDLEHIDWVPFAFSGLLDGNGHSIYNLNIRACGLEPATVMDGNRKTCSGVFSGLFSIGRNAEVRNLILVDSVLSVSSDLPCFAGFLFGFSDGCQIDNCTVTGRASLQNNAQMGGIGGIIGYGAAAIQNTSAAVELVFTDRYSEGRCEQFLGGILSCGRASIRSCSVDLNGYVSCNGYVHSGGLVGMYAVCGLDWQADLLADNLVNGSIHFYENNRDRRAYCKPYDAENLVGALVRQGNQNHFYRDEVFDYSRFLTPESCESPHVEAVVTPPGCETWGYTTHRCSGCNYSYRDSYLAPSHVPGKFVEVTAPQVGSEGLEEQRCTECGTVLALKHIPALPQPMFCRLEQIGLTLKKGSHFTLTTVLEHCTESDLLWSSSDPSVAVVDSSGRIDAFGKGSCTIQVTTADGSSSDTCTVRVIGFLEALIHNLFGSK